MSNGTVSYSFAFMTKYLNQLILRRGLVASEGI